MTRKEFEKRREELAEQLDEAKCALEEFASEIRDHYEEKSEKWQESEKGQAFMELVDEAESQSGEVENAGSCVAGLEWPA